MTETDPNENASGRPRNVGGMALRILTSPLDPDGKNPVARAMGHAGGSRRQQTLSTERISEIARLAVEARWRRHRARKPELNRGDLT